MVTDQQVEQFKELSYKLWLESIMVKIRKAQQLLEECVCPECGRPTDYPVKLCAYCLEGENI